MLSHFHVVIPSIQCLHISNFVLSISHLCYVWCIQEGLTDLVECGVGQCRTLRKVTMATDEYQTLTSSIFKGMIQNPSLEQVELLGCDFKGRFYSFKYRMYCLWT